MITETPPVKAALDALWDKLGEGERIDFAELVTLVAEVKARRIAADDAARKRLAEMVRGGSFPFRVDLDAADQAKRLGLIANYGE